MADRSHARVHVFTGPGSCDALGLSFSDRQNNDDLPNRRQTGPTLVGDVAVGHAQTFKASGGSPAKCFSQGHRLWDVTPEVPTLNLVKGLYQGAFTVFPKTN